MRRLFDISSATVGLVLLSPFLVVIAVAIKLEDGGPIFYSHPRVGRNFLKFGLLKFRSMVPNAASIGGPVTAAGDPRVTRIGRVLRKYKLDELPQLLNVVKGDISLVGARPEVERYVNLFRPTYAEILRNRPGITDPATLVFRNEEEMLRVTDVEERYITDILPRKLELSLAYTRQRTFVSDLGIVLRTLLGICWTPGPAQNIETARQSKTPAGIQTSLE